MSDRANEHGPALRHSALTWLRVSDLALRRLRLLDEVTDTRVDVDEPGPDAAYWHQSVQSLADARLLLIAYKHVYTALKLLKEADQLSPEESLAYGAFCTAYWSRIVGDLRNVLEHWEEYVVGRGRNRKLRLAPRHPLKARRDWHWDRFHRPVVTIELGGSEYELNSVESAARQLWEALDPDNAPRPTDAHER